MACPQSPADTLAILLACAQTHLVERELFPAPSFLPPLILVGAEGVTKPYGCCDGILAVEAIPPIIRDPDVGPGLVTGCEPCDLTMLGTYRVTVKQCAPPFAVGAAGMAGAPKEAAERNALALMLVEESWAMVQALRCCINTPGEGRPKGWCACGNVTTSGTKLGDGCAEFWTEIEWEHTPCC